MGTVAQFRHIYYVCLAGLILAAGSPAQILVDAATSENVTLTGRVPYRNVGVTSTTPASFNFTLTEQDVPNLQWLRVCVGGGISCAAPGEPGQGTTNTILTIQLANDLGSYGTGPFNATIALTPASGGSVTNIFVTFVPGAAGTNSTVVTPANLSVSVAKGGTATSTLALQNLTAEPVLVASITPTTVDGSNWLTASVALTTINANSSILLTIQTNAANLASGTYSGNVQLAFNPGAPIVIPVGLNVVSSGVVVSSGSLAFTYTNGISSAQQLTVSGTPTYSASALTNSGGAWLTLTGGGLSGTQLTNISTAQPLTVLIGAAVGNLQTGVYQGSISITGSDGSQAGIAVTLLVNVSGPTGVVANPTSLNFAYQTGQLSPPPQTIVVTQPANAAYSVRVDSPWLSPATVSGTIPGNLQIYVDPRNLTPNTYSGNISITAGGLTQTIPVMFVVSNNPVVWGSYPVANGIIGTVLFSSQGGTASPTSQAVTLTASDFSMPVYRLVSYPNWTTTTLNQNQLMITPNVSGLSAAVYSDNVVISATNSANNIADTPFTVPVVLVANGGGTGTPLTLSQTSFSFQGSATGPAPATQVLTVTASTATVFAATTVGPWLSISPSGTNLVTPKTLIISVDPTQASAGNNSGAISLTANGATQTVPVTFLLSGSGVTAGTIVTDQSSLSFTAGTGGTPPAGQTITVSNAQTGTAPISFTVSTTAPWLKSSAIQGSTQATLTITVDPTGLAANTYTGGVTITPAGGTAVTVPVTFTVQPLPAVTVATNSLNFVYRSGSANPIPQTVLVSGNGGFTAVAAAANSATWLSVSPASGNAGSNITVAIDPTGLAAGSYSGTVTVSGTNGLSGQAVINVSVSVLAALPTIDTVGNGGSYAQGGISPGEVITIKGSNLGPAQPVTAQFDSTGKIATLLGGAQVLVSGINAPIIYASAAQVSAVVPYEVASLFTATVAVKYSGQTSNALTIPIVATAPGIFTQDTTGTGAGAYNADFSLNGPDNPAPRGASVVLFLTGEGQTVPPGVTGTVNSATDSQSIPVPAASINVFVDGLPATYSYAGGVPGTVEGILQLNLQIPMAAPSGTVPVLVVVGGNSTQSGVTVSVQ